MKLDVEQLLTIDVDSEVRKLAEAELGGTWQIPAELVRRSLRAGATRIEIDLRRGNLAVRDDARPLERETVEHLGALLDPAEPPHARHRALLALEAASDVGLISLAALKATGVRVACDGADVLLRGAPEVGAVSRHGVEISLEGVDIDVKQARKWLQIALRFAPAAIVVDGAELERGRGDTIVEGALLLPLEGTIALLRSAEASRVWLLRWGVVATHTMLPGGSWVEASVELGERGVKQVGAGELRAAFKDVLAEVEAQGLDLALTAAAAIGKLPPDDQHHLRMLLLGTKNAKLPAVRRVKMLPALYGPAHSPEWTSIDQLLHHADGKPALFVENDAKAADAVTHQPIFVLTGPERARLGQLFQVAFVAPPSRPPDRRLSLRAVAESVTRTARAAASAVKGGWQKALPEEALTALEKRALATLRASMARSKRPAFSEVVVVSGDGPAHLKGRAKKLVLPRDNREVATALRLVARDPSWAYPALVALLQGAAMPPSSLRDSWSRG